MTGGQRSVTWSLHRQLLAFLVLTFGFSWGLWLPAVAASQGRVLAAFPLWPLGSFGPSLAGVLVIAACYGRPGLRSLGSRVSRWRVRPRWYVFAIGFPLAVTFLVVIVDRTLAGTTPTLPAFPVPREFVVVFVVVLLLGGPMSEEFGWRGYFLPALQHRLTPRSASVVVGVTWAVWHLPLFFITESSQAGLPVAWLCTQWVALAVLFTWVYNRTGGSLLVVIAFHAALNTTSVVFPVLPTVTESFRALGLTVAVTVVAAVIVAVSPGGLRNAKAEQILQDA